MKSIGKGKFDDDSATFSDLGEFFWGSRGTYSAPQTHMGFLGSATHICPRDDLEGSAIVDVLGDDTNDGANVFDATNTGRATHYVSWC